MKQSNWLILVFAILLTTAACSTATPHSDQADHPGSGAGTHLAERWWH